MSIGKLAKFNVETGDWTCYIQRMEMFCRANKIEEELWLPTLITALGDDGYALLRNLCCPEKPSDMAYGEVVKLMADHLQPRPSFMAERYRFHQRKQSAGETILQYLAELKTLAKFCDFKSGLAENLRDQLICGLENDRIRQRLFKERNLHYSDAVRISCAMEATERDAATVDGSCKETVNTSAGGGDKEDEANILLAQRQTFTRVEMARVLKERNQYKESLKELQDAVRWTEMVRASRVDTKDKKNKQSIWKFFSNLSSTRDRPQRSLSAPNLRVDVVLEPAMDHSRTQASETQLTHHHHASHEKTKQSRQVHAHVRKEDGRTHADWCSLPSKTGQGQKGPSSVTSLSSGAVPVPVPVFCRPIAENEPRMTLLCAAAVNLTGGVTPDGGCMVGESVFYANQDDKTENTKPLGSTNTIGLFGTSTPFTFTGGLGATTQPASSGLFGKSSNEKEENSKVGGELPGQSKQSALGAKPTGSTNTIGLFGSSTAFTFTGALAATNQPASSGLFGKSSNEKKENSSKVGGELLGQSKQSALGAKPTVSEMSKAQTVHSPKVEQIKKQLQSSNVGGELLGQSKQSRLGAKPTVAEMSKAQSVHSPIVDQINEQLQSTQSVGSAEKTLSSLVWICACNQDNGIVMIVDANNPAEVIESFTVSDKHMLCVASVPGALADDYREYMERAAGASENIHHPIVDANNPAEVIESFTVSDKHMLCVASVPGALADDYREYMERAAGASENIHHPMLSKTGRVNSVDVSSKNRSSEEDDEDSIVVGNKKLVKSTILTPPRKPVNEPATKADNQNEEPPNNKPETHDNKGKADNRETSQDRVMSTVMATMWLGTKSGNLYVHSAVGNYKKCLARLKLNDAILGIVACASRCIVAVADGTVAIFSRQGDGQWDFAQYWRLTLGEPKCSVRCLSAVGRTVWCGYRNYVHVIEPRSKTVLYSLEAHPRQESQVRHMACDGDGVWVSMTMDSTLRLYHAHTYEHLKDFDIELCVSKMLSTGKLGFSLVRITALLISSGRLWVGTSSGVVISVPLSKSSSRDSIEPQPLYGRHRLTQTALTSYPSGNIPWCSIADAQLSYHGYSDKVAFLVAIPGLAGSGSQTPESPRRVSPTTPLVPPMLVISGGEGYIDFRPADSEMEDSVVVAEDGSSSGHSSLAERASKSHLIVWQVASA